MRASVSAGRTDKASFARLFDRRRADHVRLPDRTHSACAVPGERRFVIFIMLRKMRRTCSCRTSS